MKTMATARKLLEIMHPDRGCITDPEDQARRTAYTAAINEAQAAGNQAKLGQIEDQWKAGRQRPEWAASAGSRGNDAKAQPSQEADQLEQLRKKLLDMTLRNPFLNIRERKTSVRITGATPTELFKILVLDGKKIELRPKNGEGAGKAKTLAIRTAGTTATTKAIAKSTRPRGPRKVETDHDRKDLAERIKRARLAAQTAVEEEGVNHLYLALGMMKWSESGTSGTTLRAPLLLIPIQLEKQKRGNQCHLSATDEEIEANVTLAKRLEDNFGIELPQIPRAGLDDPDEYFQQARAAIAEHANCSVESNTCELALLSFTKLWIYKDLAAKGWSTDIKTHPLLGRLLGTVTPRTRGAHYPDNCKVDEEPATAATPLVQDADSSQRIAIAEAQKSEILVVEGPPGTGKSQTIVNLIAEAVRVGKTVLFVSEKLAALEVVKAKLDHLGLGEVCTNLHNPKTKKSEIYTDLARAADAIGKPATGCPNRAARTQKAAQDAINGYAKAINTVRTGSGETIGDLIGKLDRIPDTADARQADSQGARSQAMAAPVDDARTAVDQLQEATTVLADPKVQVLWPCGRASFLQHDQLAARNTIQRAIETLQSLDKAITGTGQCLRRDTSRWTISKAKGVSEALQHASRKPQEAPPTHRDERWHSSAEALTRAADAVEAVSRHRTRHAEKLLTAWSDNELRNKAEQCAKLTAKRWPKLHPGYWRLRHRLKKTGKATIGTEPQDWNESIKETQTERRLAATAAQAWRTAEKLGFEKWKANKPTPKGETVKALRWLISLHGNLNHGLLDETVLDAIETEATAKDLREDATRLRQKAEEADQAWEKAAGALDFRNERLQADEKQKYQQVRNLLEWLQKAADGLVDLSRLTNYNRADAEVRKLGLTTIADRAPNLGTTETKLVEIFERHRILGELEKAYAEEVQLKTLTRKVHDETIERFQRTDKATAKATVEKILSGYQEKIRHWTNGVGVTVITREAKRKRRQMPIRTLMGEAGRTVLQLKPVFLMSPLSIPKYLPPDTVQFDQVIFDEASQVEPIDAYGAVLRARQIVVVGDDKQLPPTPFFRKSDDDDSEEPYEASDSKGAVDTESILGQAVASQAVRKRLRWHYRSRHESLIALSNERFYENDLVIFPSPDKGRTEKGLHLEIDRSTVYESGRTKGWNRKEAALVAKAAIEHARATPNLTLGIATFSSKQARAISDALEAEWRQPETSEAIKEFFEDDSREPFFVKNLETVQGDERDVILISIGYGRTADGKLPHRFGPVNQTGGERRLNVLFTRARNRVVVFSNFSADEMRVANDSSEGVKTLQAFLRYAESGNIPSAPQPRGEAETPFEAAVADELTKRGYKVELQVGDCGYRIDMAIIDPEEPGRYLIGIECDGATYHSAQSARDRDRLRQQVLEDQGWTLHRVWSTDWFADRETEAERIVDAIKAAKTARQVSKRNGERERGTGANKDGDLNKSGSRTSRTHEFELTA